MGKRFDDETTRKYKEQYEANRRKGVKTSDTGTKMSAAATNIALTPEEAAINARLPKEGKRIGDYYVSSFADPSFSQNFDDTRKYYVGKGQTWNPSFYGDSAPIPALQGMTPTVHFSDIKRAEYDAQKQRSQFVMDKLQLDRDMANDPLFNPNSVKNDPLEQFKTKPYNFSDIKRSEYSAKNEANAKLPKFDEKYKKDFEDFYQYRYELSDAIDWDEEKQENIPKWQNMKKQLMQKYGWTEAEFDKKFGEYDSYRTQKALNDEVKLSGQFAKEHPVAGTVLSFGPEVENVLMGLTIAGATAADAVSGGKLTGDNGSSFSGIPSVMAQDAMREGASSNIDSGIGKSAYNFGVSLADMGADVALGGGTPLGRGLVVGAKTTSRNLQNSMDRGVDPTRAGLYSTGTGIISGVLAGVGLDKVLSAPAESLLGGVVNAGITEGLENIVESGADKMVDNLINQDKSEMLQSYNAYRQQGMSDNDAWTQVAKDVGIDLAKEGITGAVFGSVFRAAIVKASQIASKSNPQVPSVDNDAMVDFFGTEPREGMLRAPYSVPEDVMNNVEVPMTPGVNIPKVGVDTDVNVPKANVDTSPVSTPKEYKIETVNRGNGKKGYYVAEVVDDTTTRNAEPGKVYKSETEAKNALDKISNATTAETAPVGTNTETPRTQANSTGIESNPTVTSEAPKSEAPRENPYQLQGEELKQAKETYKKNRETINALKNEVDVLKKSEKSYRGGKMLKDVQKRINARNKEIRALEAENRKLYRGIKGQSTPIKEQLSKEDRDYIYNYKTRNSIEQNINYMVNYAGKSEEAVQMGKDLKKLVDNFVKTGDLDLLQQIWDKAVELETLARSTDAEYVNSNFKHVTDYFGDEAGILADSIVSNSALRKAYELNEVQKATDASYNSTPVETEAVSESAPTESPTHIDEGRIIRDEMTGNGSNPQNVPTENVAPEVPTVQPTETPAPAEVPNVTNEAATTRPTNEVPSVTNPEQRSTKTSGYYKNTMRNTEVNSHMDNDTFKSRFDEKDYQYFDTTDQKSVAEARGFIDEVGDEEAIDTVLNKEFGNEEGTQFDHKMLDATEILAEEAERRALALEETGQDATDQWILANKLHKRARQQATLYAQGLEALKKWKKSTPQGAVDALISEANTQIDRKRTKGYSNMVENLADDVGEVITSDANDATKVDKIREVFEKNRKKNKYNTTKAEQQVLDIIKDPKSKQMSAAKLAEEIGRIIKRNMGVSTLTTADERAMIGLFNKALEYDKGSRAYNECISRALQIYDQTLPSSLSAKVKSIIYDNMLLSLKTMVTRNFGGNVGAKIIETAAKPLQVGADVVASKFTGNRTRTLTGKSIIAGAKGFGKGVKDWALDIAHNTNTTRSGQESLEDAMKAALTTFKTQSDNKFVKGVNKAGAILDRVVRKGMEVGDRPIYEMTYAATKAELLEVVDKFGDEGLRSGLPEGKDYSTEDLIDFIATREALEAVLQNDSPMKTAAQDFKSFLKGSSEAVLGFDILSTSNAPFVEVPANMAYRFFQYTPFGVVGNVARSVREKYKYGSVNQRRMTGEAGRNALGGLLTAGAIGLARAGMVSDPYSEDKEEKKLQQNNNYIEYALQAPDQSWQADISDIPVVGPMLQYGKKLSDAYDEGGIGGAISKMPSAAGAATVDSLFQGLNRLSGQNMDRGDFMSNAWNSTKSAAASMLIPQLVRQTAQFTDDSKRDLGEYNSDEYYLNSILNGLPGARETLAPKIDTSGNVVPEAGGATGFERFFNTYIAPWKVTHPKAQNSESVQYADWIKEQTNGEAKAYPDVIDKQDVVNIKGYVPDNYTHEDLVKLQKEAYPRNEELRTTLIHQDWFNKLDPHMQADFLNLVEAASLGIAKEHLMANYNVDDEKGKYSAEDVGKIKALVDVIRNDDANHTQLINFFRKDADRLNLQNEYGVSISREDYDKQQAEYPGGAKGHAEDTVAGKELGLTASQYRKAEDSYAGGAVAKSRDIENARQYGFTDSDGSVSTDAYTKALEIVGDDPNALSAYSNYRKQGMADKKQREKITYLMNNNSFTPEAKAKMISKHTDPADLDKGPMGAYNIGGWADVYYYYLIRDLADFNGDGNGTVSGKELRNFLDTGYNNGYGQYLNMLSQDMYNYLYSYKK